MQDLDDDVEVLAKMIGTTYENLISLAFHRIIAYGTAWAIQTPRQEGAPKLPSVDSRVRRRLGEATYNGLYEQYFPLVVATLFQTIEQDGTSDKLLSRDASLASAKVVMDDIVSIAVSDTPDPEPLKPSFKVKVVLNALHHICHRWGYDETKLWSPPIFTFVARKLFDTIDRGLGPLHTCAVIRKIRLLVCLAGKTVHEGYPLEMLIHGLKPFIVNTFCAQDTVGIVQYLFINGKTYLQTNPTFVVSTFLSIMSSLRAFIATTPDSQVESSQFRSSQSTAQSFHSWLCDYLSDYHSTAMNNANAETFKALVDCAIGFKSNGNAFKGTKEGELLQVLLMDESNENGLLDDVSKHVAFSLISSNFTRPESYREDMLGADRDSITLGRAYAASGTIYSEWTQEAELAKETDLPNNSNTLAIIPKAAILKHLTGFLFSGDRRKVGLAEITLIDIFHQEKNADKDRTLISDLVVSMHLLKALGWDTPPQNPPPVPNVLKISEAGKVGNSQVQDWIRNFAIAISLNTADAVGNRVAPLLQSVDGLAEKLFPYLVHIMLILEGDDDNSELRQSLSAVFRKCFRDRRTFSVPHMAILIKTILYLRTQAREGEKTKLARDDWLDLDYQDLAKAACICRMYKTALMLVEIHCSRKKTDFNECAELLLEIYTNIDDPDSFYGLSRGASLGTVISKLEYEQDGWKCLSFRGAQMESSLRLRSEFNNIASIGAINALNILGLNGLSHSFLQGGILGFGDEGTSENGYESAWKLEQWNLPCPVAYNGRAPIVYRALQSINNTVSTQNFQAQLDTSFLDVMKQITSGKQTSRSLRANIRTLAMLTEVEEVLSSENSVQLQEVWGRLERRIPWMKIANFSEVEEILSIRQVTFSSIAKRQHLQDKIQIDLRAARMYQAKALSSVCELARIHKVHQHALSACTHLSDIVAPCQEIGLDISAVAALQTANVLWDQGEILTSIRVLQELDNAKSDMITQDISIGRTELLATLGCWISEARLEKPELIMAQYLERSIRELTKERPKCEVAGRVFHEFAVFCDRQLSNQNNIEDYERASKLRENKHAEILEAERQMKSASGSKLEQLKSFRGKAKQLLNLDELEYIRLRENREAFLEKSIGNYLRCLEVCDDYDQDAIRFCSLWLQYSTNEKANRAASLTLNKVPSRKFVSLMNQLSSRMLDQKDDFQELLLPLILRICRDHPYHGIYQILSVTKSKSKDHLSHSRATMASTVAMTLKKENKFAGQTMNKIYAAISTYIKVAAYKMDKKSSKIPIRKAFPEEPTLASKIEREIPSLKLPPPTMNIEIRADCDYTNLPYLQKFNPELSVASSGVSAPKILTCHDSSGQSYKMLVKGGNDDLRQDAIMEQVFEQVSHLLQRNRQARQRNLGIRTYKVLPLSVQTGIIEFVPNTIPLHEYLIPAHQAYHPKEWTASKCRSTITSVQEQSREMRVEAFLKVMRNYSPVMRYFFMHQFDGPDEWFRSRLAYTRSTAAISILGYVLGLGDRHGHNILLDEKSGEVVHIDLGVAFEQGRVLPIPEVVPFRLTRDIVDGMGVTGTEGVFRRCCEFTLSVLRIEKDNITTILDVLRYDPLYSWTISPIKMQRMQQGNFELEVKKEDPDIDLFAKPNAGNKQEAEAERALEIVNKKLSQALSVSATVNELIQQASDVKNLAVLFGGIVSPLLSWAS
ncbi:hypothetical protein BDZ91DRAFT_649584 [Kalaharituber pfeilii]|nr:hypothetical protein BDZ91DRAFT_649584 [Kalaharituber pfeilii]